MNRALLVAFTFIYSTSALTDNAFISYIETWGLPKELSADSERVAVFQRNSAIVANLTDLYPDAEFSLHGSPFSHLTFKEFAAMRLPLMGTKSHRGSEEAENEVSTRLGEVPDSFDWRKAPFNAVTDVKNQGALGSCWAFSAVGNVEGQRAVRTNGTVLESLSVEQLVECSGNFGPRYETKGGRVNGNCGEFGGWPYLAYQFWESVGGVRTDAQMPYCSGIPFEEPGNCLPCMAAGYNKTLCGDHSDLFCNQSTTLGQGTQNLCSTGKGTVAKLKGHRRISTDEAAIAAELVATGPLSIALDATLPFQFYKRGILDPKGLIGGCGKDAELNHAVLLIGFGTDGGKDYWTVKNSWGTKWGEDGFFRFIRGHGRCGINTEVTTAILE